MSKQAGNQSGSAGEPQPLRLKVSHQASQSLDGNLRSQMAAKNPAEIDFIKRTTMIVRDAEKAARWYEDVFRMSRYMDVPFTLSGTQLAAGKKGDATRLVIMKARHDDVGMIGLLEWIDPVRDDFPRDIPDEIPAGTPIFVVASQDSRGTLERARSAGSKIHCEPREWTVTAGDGTIKDMIGVSFWDLDGAFFEVNQVVGTRAK